MDLNRLYVDHQVSLIRPQDAGTAELRRGHAAGLGAAAACAWVARSRELAA
jgi:hypothetical protein